MHEKKKVSRYLCKLVNIIKYINLNDINRLLNLLHMFEDCRCISTIELGYCKISIKALKDILLNIVWVKTEEW